MSRSHVLSRVALAGSTFALIAGCGDDGAVCEGARRSLASRGVTVVGSCSTEGAREALGSLSLAIDTLPREPALPPFSVRLDASNVGAAKEPHVSATSGEIVVDPSSPATRDVSIWLHEIAHATAHTSGSAMDDGGGNGERDARARRAHEPTNVARLRRAIEEGFADYYAASAQQTPKIGAVDGREVRDLERGETINLSEWATLPFSRAPFDAHRFGSALAARAFAVRGYDLAFARAGLEALAHSRDARDTLKTPAALVESLAPNGAPFSNELRTLLSTWLPPELGPNVPPR